MKGSVEMKNKSLVIILLISLLVLTSTTLTNASALETIRAEEEISFAMSGEYPPFNYYELNELAGFDVDVAKEIASRMDAEAEFVTTAWDGIIPGLTSGHYDTILGSMAITDQRLEAVNFTIPYYYSGAQIVVTEDSDIDGPTDIEGKTVGVVTGTTFEEDAQELGAEINSYEGDNETMMELRNGRVDAVITDRVVGLEFLNEGFDIEFAGELLRQETMAIALRKESDRLLVELNQILFEMHQDGTLTEISEEWFDADITQR